MTMVKNFRRLLSTWGTLSFIIRQYQQTQNLKSWQTEKYINNEYISLTHGVEEHWQEAWVYCMQWVSLFLTGRFALKRIWIYCGNISQVNVASLHITLFGQGPFWSMCWVSFQANLPVFDRADLLCFDKICNPTENAQLIHWQIHRDMI